MSEEKEENNARRKNGTTGPGIIYPFVHPAINIYPIKNSNYAYRFAGLTNHLPLYRTSVSGKAAGRKEIRAYVHSGSRDDNAPRRANARFRVKLIVSNASSLLMRLSAKD